MNPFEAKIFKGATPEEKFEVALMALGNFVKTLTQLAIRLEELIDCLEGVVKRFETKSWEKAINAELDRRKNQNASIR